MQRKKILILTPFPYVDEPSMGGTVTWVTGVLEELVKYKKFDTHILTVSDSIKEYTIKKRYGVTVHYEPSPKYFPALIKGTTIDNYRLLRRIRKIKPDLVHPYITLPPYGSASLFSGFPVVLSISGVVRNEAATYLGKKGMFRKLLNVPLEKFTLKRMKTIIVETPYVADSIKEMTKGNIYIIPTGIVGGFFNLKKKPQSNRLLILAGIEPRKGHHVLFKAVNTLKKDFPLLKLYVVGRVRNQAYYKQLVDYVNENDLSKNIIFTGLIPDEEVFKQMSKCTLLISSSFEESQSNVLGEAMAFGTPIVASNSGGCTYSIDDGITGYIVPKGDHEALAEKIGKLLKDNKLRGEMSIESKKAAKQKFLSKNLVKKIVGVYDGILGN